MAKAKKEVDTALVARANNAMTIAHELRAVVERIIEAGGECDENAFADLQSWQAALEIKAENIGHVKTRLDGEVEYYKAVEDAARARRKAVESAQERLKRYLRDAMLTADRRSIKGELFTFSVQDGRERVEIIDPGKLPSDMVRIVEEIKPITDNIKAALKAGADVPGAELLIGESFLTIRAAGKKSDDAES
jgi:hypothetical protein